MLSPLTGYVDRATGEVVIPFRYTGESDYSAFKDGFALPANAHIVIDADDEVIEYWPIYCLIDEKGNEYPLPDGFDPDTNDFHDFVY